MNDLIKLVQARIGTETVNAVNARDLHAFLEVGKDFSTWIKQRIAQYGFECEKDYVLIDSPELGNQTGRGGDRRSKEYFISIDMAKELSMVERNEKGKQARQYFIDCERRANSRPTVSLPDFTSPSIAARAWAEQHERADHAIANSQLLIEKLGQLLDEYKQVHGDNDPMAGMNQPQTKHHPTPLMELLDTIASSGDSPLNITQLCKQIAAKHGTKMASLRAVFYRHLSKLAQRDYYRSGQT